MKGKEYGFLELGFGSREKKGFGGKSHYPFCYVLELFFFEKSIHVECLVGWGHVHVSCHRLKWTIDLDLTYMTFPNG